MRPDGDFAFVFEDDDTDLHAWKGLDAVAACLGEDPPFVFVSQQAPLVNFQGEFDRIVARQFSDDISIAVWPGPIDCATVLTMDPIAAGTGRLRVTDNDALAFCDEPPSNRNAFGAVIHGQLEDSYGITRRFASHARYTWDNCEGPVTETIKILLR